MSDMRQACSRLPLPLLKGKEVMTKEHDLAWALERAKGFDPNKGLMPYQEGMRAMAAEIARLRADFARIYQATIDNPEKLTIGDIARIAKGNAT